MVPPGHHAKRVETVAAPTGAGITSGITQSNLIPTAPTLYLDPTALSVSQTAPDFGISSTPVVTLSPSSPSTPSTSPSIAATSSSPISISTVVGACVGALIGAIALIVLALWFYKRYARSLKQHGRSRRVIVTARNANAHAEQGRRRSHLEPWDKLGEGDDKWERMTKEVDNVAPMEKLTMFKKSTPSVRTAYTNKSADEPVTFDSHSFAQYHPNLAQELASEDKLPDLPIARHFLGRVDTGQAVSWDGDSLRENSYVDGRGTMSPTPNMAIPTPVATKSHSHHWESAEVLEYVEPEPTSIKSQNPFENDHREQRKSTGNPFFSAQGSQPIRRPRSNSTRSTGSHSASIQSRTSSIGTIKPKAEEPLIPKADKGKGRAIEINDDPFVDGNIPTLPGPFASHHTSGSLTSDSSNERALQSLIAALDISAEDAQERLRIASMQPSVISTASVYTSGSGGDEDVTHSFPLPPMTEGATKFR
ncbi:hypothetical protein H2248_008678 [Termitomyces sp. 'cryptogamus']|nr:hypothetical protein H2248_008678 [Termitomyces sp. 'cryptogamus']